MLDGNCFVPKYNESSALASAERILASYATINASLSLLPYYTLVNESKVSYLQSQDKWLVVMPYVNPYSSGQISNLSMILYGANLSLSNAFLQTVKPISYTNNSVAGLGAVSIYGKALCTTSKPIPVYLITDPYAPGAMSGIYTAINASERYGSDIKMSYYFIFSGYSIRFYDGYGIERTQSLGRYLSCASKQQDRFTPFMANLSIMFIGTPISESALDEAVIGSGMNMSHFNACLDNVTSSLNYQSQLASLYNVVSTPEFIVDCKYASMPQTLDYAVSYAFGSIGN
jgi:hypothetical protein